jgi:hypothetical protein
VRSFRVLALLGALPLAVLAVLPLATLHGQSPAATSVDQRVATAAGQVALGRLTGSVTDAAGAPLPGITLELSGPGVREPRTVVTDREGRFEFLRLPAGRFELTCSAPGFVPWRREDIEIESGAGATLNVQMRRAIASVRPPQPPRATPGVPTIPGVTRPPPTAGPPVGSGEPPPLAGGTASPEPEPEHALLDEIDRYLEQLDLGNLAFNAPERMLMGETTEMRLLLSPTLAIDELQQKLADLPGVLQGEAIRVAPRMEAVLSGQNFRITAITPALQAVSRGEPTEWRWEVSPTTPGDHRLHLALNARVTDTARTLRTFDRTIQVNVTAGQRLSSFVGNNWKWLWTTALVPLAGWLWQRRRRKT